MREGMGDDGMRLEMIGKVANEWGKGWYKVGREWLGWDGE